MEQVLIVSAEVIDYTEFFLKNIKLKGEINREEFELTVQKGNDGIWSIPMREIGSNNNKGIKIAYKYFARGIYVTDDIDELSSCEQLDKIPEFCRQMIAAASAADAVCW